MKMGAVIITIFLWNFSSIHIKNSGASLTCIILVTFAKNESRKVICESVLMFVAVAEKSSTLTELTRQTNRSSLAVGGVSSLSNLAAAATLASPVGDGTSLASQLAAMTTGLTSLSNSASSRSLASLQVLASASMMDKQGGLMSDRLKLDSVSLESILPTLNGPSTVAVSSVSIDLMTFTPLVC